jgi:hypothetical protein
MLFSKVQIGMVVFVAGVMAAQSLIFDEDITWQNNTGRVLHQFPAPLNWAAGTTYRRVEVKSKPTNLKVGIELCVWSGGETCSGCDPYFTETGTYYRTEHPASWWTLSGSPISGWSSHGDRAYILANERCEDWIATCGNAWCMGPSAAQHLPVTVHITEYYVDQGESFDCPEDWAGADIEGCESMVSVEGVRALAVPENGVRVTSVSAHGVSLLLPGPGTVALYSAGGKLLARAEAGVSGRASISGLSIVPGVLLARTESTAGTAVFKFVVR